MDIVALMSPEGRRDERGNPFGTLGSIGLEIGLGLTEAFVYPAEKYGKKKLLDPLYRAMRGSSALSSRYVVGRKTERAFMAEKINQSARNYLKGTFTLLGVSMAFSFTSWLLKPKINKIAVQRDQQIFYDESYMDTAAAYTQRQRALQAIMDNQMSVQHVIGNEASYMHR